MIAWVYFLICAIEIIGYIAFFDIFLEWRYKGKNRILCYLALYAGIFISVIFGNMLYPINAVFIKVIAVILICTIFSKVCFKTGFLMGLFLSTQNYFLLYFQDVIFIGIIVREYQYGIKFIIGVISIRLIWYLELLLLKIKLSKNKSYFTNGNIAWSRFVWIPMISIFAGIYYCRFLYDSLSILNVFHRILAIAIVGLNLFSLFLLQDLLIRDEKLRQSEQLLQRKSHQLLDFQERQILYEQQGKKLHDYKKQLRTVQELLRKGQVDAALSFTEKLTTSISVDLSEINVGHPIVNAVLNQQYRIAKEKGVGLTFSVSELQDIPLTDDEIVVLLGNLLENAICECEKIVSSGKKAVVHLKLLNKDETLILMIENPVLRIVEIEDNKVVKRENGNHGIGLANAEHIVNKYDGDFEISCDDKEFMVVVMISL